MLVVGGRLGGEQKLLHDVGIKFWDAHGDGGFFFIGEKTSSLFLIQIASAAEHQERKQG